jgi:hypothetical protein
MLPFLLVVFVVVVAGAFTLVDVAGVLDVEQVVAAED